MTYLVIETVYAATTAKKSSSDDLNDNRGDDSIAYLELRDDLNVM